MATIPARIANRLAGGLKRYQPILEAARARDANEGDTVVIVTDILSDLFGYDKYAEVTKEHAVRGTYCDLAVKVEGKLRFLIEVKAVGLDLRGLHVKQAVDYAANQGMDWVALTNGIAWQVYRVKFAKPIDADLAIEFDFLQLDAKKDEHIDSLFLLTKESLAKSALEDHWDKKEATNRFCLAAALLSDPVLLVIRRELKRVTPDLKVSLDELRHALTQEVLKREVTEGPKADQARKQVARSAAKALRANADSGDEATAPEAGAIAGAAASDCSAKQTPASTSELATPPPVTKPS